jgi:hypothetical protein
MNDCLSLLKLTLKPSVGKHNRSAGCSCESGWVDVVRLDVSEKDTPSSSPKGRNGQGYQGHSQSPKAPMGQSFEHRNLDLSAQGAMLGKPPGPVMSQARGGVSVVVRARESRAHGGGRQVDEYSF